MAQSNDSAASGTRGAFRRLCLATSMAVLAAVPGCTSYPVLQSGPVVAAAKPNPDVGQHHTPSARPLGASSVEILKGASVQPAGQAGAPTVAATKDEIDALLPERDVEISLVPQSLSQFIDTVFGEILRTPYYTGPGVAQRREIVALRGPNKLSTRQLFVMTQMTLQQYGLAVQIEGGSVRIIQDAAASGQAPTFIRTRTSPETPAASRPVIQFFAVSSLDVGALMALLNEVYPNRGSVRFTAEAETNTLMMSGMSHDVAAAASVVEQIDRPRFAGGQIARIKPIFMSTEQLAQSLTQVLVTEGYQVSNNAEGRQRAIALLPVQSANQLLVFAADPGVFERALYWASQLDRASALGDADGTFVYTVQNTSAEELGALVAQVSPNAAAMPTPQLPPEEAVRRTNGQRAGNQTGTTPSPPSTIGNLTIDPAGNRILFRGSPSEYEHVRALLEQLDTPPRQVLIELTIAEVTLTDDTRFGVEWFLDQTITNGTLTASTRSGSGRQPDGLGVTATHIFSRGSVQAALSAFAENRNLNILSTPRLVARSGSEAQILVGTDVPIITSQRAANAQTSGDTDVLQTVQYRQTGVILNVRPIVYGDNRIDLALYQEVSSQQPNDTAAISSPLILNRSVTTQLSLQEGMTAVIGGLIQDSYTRDQRGVPFLKDLPVVGAAFRNDRVSGDKVELLLLVTPYIIRDAEDMTAIADTLSRSVNGTLRQRGVQVYTLYPWRSPFATDQDHAAGSLRAPEEHSPVAAEPVAAVDPTAASGRLAALAVNAAPAASSVGVAKVDPDPALPPKPSTLPIATEAEKVQSGAVASGAAVATAPLGRVEMAPPTLTDPALANSHGAGPAAAQTEEMRHAGLQSAGASDPGETGFLNAVAKPDPGMPGESGPG